MSIKIKIEPDNQEPEQPSVQISLEMRKTLDGKLMILDPFLMLWISQATVCFNGKIKCKKEVLEKSIAAVIANLRDNVEYHSRMRFTRLARECKRRLLNLCFQKLAHTQYSHPY